MSTSRVHADYHQFNIVADEDYDEDAPLQDVGRGVVLLFEPRTTRVPVSTGISTGSVEVTVEAMLAAPLELDESWQDVAEVSVEVRDSLEVFSWGGAVDGLNLGRLNAAGPGSYRVRIHASGRDEAPDLAVAESDERYLIAAWPAPFEPPATLRATSQTARSEAPAE